MPRRPQKFQDLAPAKEVIVELRQKRASYRAIAELLTQHCLPTSKTAIATFCHEILGEITRPKRRLNRKRPFPLTATSENGHETPTALTPLAAPPGHAGETSDANEAETIPGARTRGPRIAQVRMLNPKTS